MQTNLRFGCVILRHYLDRERGDLFLALGRYNGSRGRAEYPNAVFAARRALGLARRRRPSAATARARRGRGAVDAEQRQHALDACRRPARRSSPAGGRTPAAAGTRSPPISVTAVMLRRCARLNGVSRTISTRRRRSFSVTSAARVSRLSPKAVRDRRQRLHRARRDDHRRRWRSEPLAMQAPMSAGRWAVGQRLERGAVEAQLVVHVEHAGRRGDQMRLACRARAPLAAAARRRPRRWRR